MSSPVSQSLAEGADGQRLELTDGVVVLRPSLPDLLEPYAEAIDESRASISQWLPWCRPEYEGDQMRRWLEQTQAWWNEGAVFEFLVFAAGSGRLVGAAGLNQLDAERLRANLGYWIRTSETGRGYATRTARLAASWGFTTLGLKRVEIVAALGNAASQRVAIKAGARQEGVLRNRLRVHGQQLDAWMYSLVPEDFGLTT